MARRENERIIHMLSVIAIWKQLLPFGSRLRIRAAVLLAKIYWLFDLGICR